jgi:GNAT superfamily N-acetyltransferase
MSLTVTTADPADTPALQALRQAVAEDWTARFGSGGWSTFGTEKGMARHIADATVLVGREGGTIVGSLRLTTKKPWSIDLSYFTPVASAIYLCDMCVRPDRQRKGIGRRLVDAAMDFANDAGADVTRLDAYEGEAGAGEFYVRCGFTERGRATYRKSALIYYERLLEAPISAPAP